MGGHAHQPVEIVMERIRRALRVQSDVGREFGEDVIAGEEQSFGCRIEADVARRVPRRPLHPQRVSTHLDVLGAVKLDDGSAVLTTSLKARCELLSASASSAGTPLTS